MSCFSPNIAFIGLQKNGRRPNPNDSRSVALSVGLDLFHRSPIPIDPISFFDLQNAINLICKLKGNKRMVCIRYILSSSVIRSNTCSSMNIATYTQ